MADDNTISIQVTATTDELNRGLLTASGQVKDFGDEVNNLAQRIQAVKPDAFKELAQQFNAGKLDLDEFRDGLIATTTATSAASTEAKALASSTGLSSSAMRELTVIGRELASGNLTRLPGSLSLLATRLGGISPAAILGAAGIAAFGYAIYKVVENSQEFESDLEKIQNAFTAVGSGNQFDRTQITQYIDDLRQIPGVTADMATSAVNDFARVRNGTQVLAEATHDLEPFADLLGVKVPEAAKILAAALNDPITGIRDLQKYGVELTATQQEEIRQMMAVNDIAGAQRVLLDGISTAMVGIVDTATPLQKFWTDFKNSLMGVSEEAVQTKQRLEDLANTASDPQLALAARTWAGVEGAKSRNLLSQNWSGSTGNVSATDKAAEQKKLNDAISDGVQLYDKGNSPLREQEEHLTKIQRLQTDLNAATGSGNSDAAQKIQAAIDQENTQYAQRTKRQEPKPDNTDNDFSALLEKETAEYDKQQAQELDGAKKLADEKVKTAEASDALKVASGELTAQQQIANEMAALEAMHTADNAYFDQLLQLYANDGANYEKVLLDKQIAQQRFSQQSLALQTKAATDQQRIDQQNEQQFDASAQRMVGPWETALTEMTTRSKTWQTAINQAGMSVENQFVGTIIKNMVSSWLLGETSKTSATVAGNAIRTASDDSAASASGGVAAAAQKGTIMNDAYTTAANVYANVSEIPYVGWALAPAAAATAFAAVAGFGMNISSAAGGMIVNSDQIAKVHENEMVLPARYTGGLTKMIDQANAGQSGGGANNHFHFSPQINGKLGPDDINGLHQEFGKFIQKGLRNGQFGGMRTS